MGLFDLLARRPRVSAAEIPVIVRKVSLGLEVAREQFLFAVLSTLKGEGIQVPGATPTPESGTEIDSMLRGYQLTMIGGFSFRYLDQSLLLHFDEAMTAQLDNGSRDTIRFYRERYLDCEGDIQALANSLAADMYRQWDNPDPQATILKALVAAAPVLGIVSQVKVAASVGDSLTEKKLMRLVGGSA